MYEEREEGKNIYNIINDDDEEELTRMNKRREDAGEAGTRRGKDNAKCERREETVM